MTFKTDASTNEASTNGAGSETAVSAGTVGGRRRPYEAPVLTAFGSVEEFTRGTGSKSFDSLRTSQKNTTGM